MDISENSLPALPYPEFNKSGCPPPGNNTLKAAEAN